jgi:superoxide dismutase, Cu-Zn family
MRTLTLLCAAVVAAACSTSSNVPRTATADLDPRSDSTVTGHAEFTETKSGIAIRVVVANAKPGKHGVHIHQVGDCSAIDASSAGDHWNPSETLHGGPHTSIHHAGDLGNIEVGTDGRGTLELTMPTLWVRAGERSIVGHALVVHADPDDLSTQPAGNSGGRIACGVITLKKT